MTERDFEENSERYLKYRHLKQKASYINDCLKTIEPKIFTKICMGYTDINLAVFSDEAKNGLGEYLKTMMFAELGRIKKEMEEL